MKKSTYEEMKEKFVRAHDQAVADNDYFEQERIARDLVELDSLYWSQL